MLLSAGGRWLVATLPRRRLKFPLQAPGVSAFLKDQTSSLPHLAPLKTPFHTHMHSLWVTSRRPRLVNWRVSGLSSGLLPSSGASPLSDSHCLISTVAGQKAPQARSDSDSDPPARFYATLNRFSDMEMDSYRWEFAHQFENIGKLYNKRANQGPLKWK